jgi:ABC-type proline/glycine betaine transport system permease subunit
MTLALFLELCAVAFCVALAVACGIWEWRRRH